VKIRSRFQNWCIKVCSSRIDVAMLQNNKKKYSEGSEMKILILMKSDRRSQLLNSMKFDVFPWCDVELNLTKPDVFTWRNLISDVYPWSDYAMQWEFLTKSDYGSTWRSLIPDVYPWSNHAAWVRALDLTISDKIRL
jgi:hypothetical protein